MSVLFNMNLHDGVNEPSGLGASFLHSAVPEYLDDPNEQSEPELGFLSSPISMTKKIKRLVEMLKYYKNQINCLENTIRNHAIKESLNKKIDSFPNLSSIAKEFGKYFLGDSEEEWPCIKCLEVIEVAINLKHEYIKKPFAIINLEIKHVDEPLSDLELDNTNSDVHLDHIDERPELELNNKHFVANFEINHSDDSFSESELDNTNSALNFSTIDDEVSVLKVNNTNSSAIDTQLEHETDDFQTENQFFSESSVGPNLEIERLNELDLELLEAKFSTADLGKYECEICQATTTSYQKLISHLRRHRGAHIYECERCGKGFAHGNNYKDHILVYQEDRPYICDVCEKGFKSPRYLQRHKLSHLTDRNIPCAHCDRMFCHQKGLQEHCLQFHIERTCSECNGIFKNSVLLRKHLAKVHGKGKTSRNKYHKVGIGPSERIPCEQCAKTFSTKANLILHNKNIHAKERKHSCPCCSKSFFTTSVLRSHMQCHINEKGNNEAIEKYARYKCDECDRTFAVLSMYREHKTIHSGLKEYSCEFCGKMFAFKTYLAKHIRVMHNTADPKNSVCSYCGKVFGNKAALRSHILTHTGETPFSCTICDSKFRYAKSLRLHTKNKHNPENV